MPITPQSVFTNQPSTVSSAKQAVAIATAPTLSSLAATVNDGNQMKWLTADVGSDGIQAATGFTQQISNYTIDNGIEDLAVLNLPNHTPIINNASSFTGRRVLALAGNCSLHDLVSQARLDHFSVRYDGVAASAKHFAKKGNMDATVATSAGRSHKIAYNEFTKRMEYYELPSSMRSDMDVVNDEQDNYNLLDSGVTAYVGRKIINPAVYERVLDVQSGRVSAEERKEAVRPFWAEIVKMAKGYATDTLASGILEAMKGSLYARYSLSDADFAGASTMLQNAVSDYTAWVSELELTISGLPNALPLNTQKSKVYKYYGQPIDNDFYAFLVLVANFIDSQTIGDSNPNFISDSDATQLFLDTDWQNIILSETNIDEPPFVQYTYQDGNATLSFLKTPVLRLNSKSFQFSETLTIDRLYNRQATEAQEAIGNLINESTNDLKLGLSWIYTDLNYGPIVQTASFSEHGVLGHVSVRKSDIPKGAIGLCLWKSTLDKAEDWQLVKQQLFADFVEDDRISASDSLPWGQTIDEYSYEEQVITSSQTNTFYFVAFRADQQPTALFFDVTGYNGRTLTGYDYIVTAGNFAVVANPCYESEEGAVVQRPDLLNVVPFNSAGSLQEVAVPINTGVQIPELTDDTIYGLTRMDRYIALITNRMISLFDVSGGGLRHVRNIFGAAPVSDQAWASNGTSLYSIAEDGLFQITPSGKQEVDSPFDFHDLVNPKLHFDRSLNELIAVSGQRVICLSSSGVYQRDYAGPEITHVFDWEGKLALTNIDNDDRIDVFIHENESLNRIVLETQPFYLGEPSQIKRVTDIWLTIHRQTDTTPSVLSVSLFGDANDAQLLEHIDLAGTATSRPITIRLRLKRVIVVDELPENSTWQLSEVNVEGTSYIRELRVNSANRPSRWFSLRVESNQAADMQIQAIQIGYKSYGSR